MNTGLLWSDSSDKKSFEDKVSEAVSAYIRRFCAEPDTCYVHPSALPDGNRVIGKVAVKSCSRVLKGHFWVGVENSVSLPAKDDDSARPSQPTLFDCTKPAVAAVA